MGLQPIALEVLRDEIARLQKDVGELGDRVASLSQENANLRRERDYVRLALASALIDLGHSRTEAAGRAKVSAAALRKYLRGQ